jgi:RNA polymerase sigma-70 factor (ECF subfamily)
MTNGDRNSADFATGNVSDGELIERIVARDRGALTLLYDRYYHPLLRFIHRLTGDIEAAQEGVNDVMLVVWNQAADFAGRSKVSTWIMGIAYRKALKLRLSLHKWVFRFKAADWENTIEPTARIEGLTDQLASQDLVIRAFRQLTPKQRAVVELAYYFGYAYGEIAEIVGCPENTVKTRMFHARARLKEVLHSLGHYDAGHDYDG